MLSASQLKSLYALALTTAFASVVLGRSDAHAYAWSECSGNPIKWGNGWTNLAISTTSFPPNSAWDARFQNAMWHWNNVKGSSFDFYVLRDTDGTHNDSNGVNEIYLDNSLSGPLAVTKTRYHCYWFFGWHYGIDETDIAFNNNYSWSLAPLSYGSLGSPYSFESVALHETGHSLGLAHEDRWIATMNSYYPNSGPMGHWKEWDPLPDDRQGGRFLYSDSTTESDIAGSAFKRTGSGTSGLVSSPSSASRGSNVTIELTFHNQSTSTKTFNIGFYLSTNDFISTADTLLGANSGASGGPGSSLTFFRTLMIPFAISPGQYWLGFIVDFDGVNSEGNESNNYMEMPRPITIN